MKLWPTALLTALVCACSSQAHASIVDTFAGPDGVILAEGQSNDTWLITSGTLDRRGGVGYTDSPVFRMVSTERDFNNTTVSVTLAVDSIGDNADWDGAHVWVRYQSEYELYAVSVDRSDNTMIIKKKCAGGSDNGGTYYNLSRPVPATLSFGDWQTVIVNVYDSSDGAVHIVADRDGHHIEAIDHGTGCAPLHGGGVGVRGDNAQIRLARIEVAEVAR